MSQAKEALKIALAVVGGGALLIGGMMLFLFLIGQSRIPDPLVLEEVTIAELGDQPDTTLYQRALFHVKWREGYRSSVYIDAAGYATTGWGLRTAYQDSLPTTREGHQRALQNTFIRYYDLLCRKYPGYERHQYLAMTSLYFNVGNFGKNLNRALKRHDIPAAVHWWGKYTYINGRHHARSAQSRAFELALFQGEFGK
jgi:GH24 family phage-related lysozyme (muramidase)